MSSENSLVLEVRSEQLPNFGIVVRSEAQAWTCETHRHREMPNFRSGKAALGFVFRNPKAADDGLSQVGR